MNIQLDPNHRLTSDKHNFIIEQRGIYKKDNKQGKKGEEFWTAILFYPFLYQAVRGYSERFLRESSVTTLAGLNEAVRGLQELVEDVRGVCNGTGT